MASVEVRIDDEEDVPYVYMEDPSAPEITFVRAPCPSKEVLYVSCSDLGTKLNSLFIHMHTHTHTQMSLFLYNFIIINYYI